ncbi:MAG TPA: DUF3619 family protein [Nitrosospira sp.]|nr:DUF3619 family protein [Nitrosospira sp.]
MTEDEIGRKATRLLDRDLDSMKQSTLNRLQAARRAALENYEAAEEMVSVPRTASAGAHRNDHPGIAVRKLVSILALLFAITAAVYWQNFQQSDENEDIDIMLLLDDVPVNAYLDDEFDAWLEGSGQ